MKSNEQALTRLHAALDYLLEIRQTGAMEGTEQGQKEPEDESQGEQLPVPMAHPYTERQEQHGGLSSLEMVGELDATSPRDPQALNLCAPVNARVSPQFKVTHERAVYGEELPISIGDDIEPGFPQMRVGCIKVTIPNGISVFLGLLLLMEQIWDLQDVAVGDLSYATSLVPGEQLTIQMQNTQRRVMEKTTLDQSEEMTSEESTTVDKEALNVTRSSTKTEKWHVNGSGRISIGNPLSLGGQLGIDAGFNSAVQQTAQVTMDQIHESTKKSAHSLKTLHKVEVRGFTEDLFDKRMTRVIRNPYPDRTLSLNVFQLVKHYQVTTQLGDKILALIISVNSLEFDDQFIGSYVDFLRNHLLDPNLGDELSLAFQGSQLTIAGFHGLQLSVERAREVAKMSLHYLYDEPNVFNLPHILTSDVISRDLGDPNPPGTSYDASRVGSGFIDSLGPEDRKRGDIARLFTILNMYYKIYKDMVTLGNIDEYAVDLALSLAQGAGPLWKVTEHEDRKITDILDNGEFTECFRRLSGFLALVEGMLKPVMSIGEEKEELQKRAAALNALKRIKNHLRCNRDYYIQKFLIHLERSTESNTIIEFVDLVIERLNVPVTLKQQLRQLLDIRRAYIDRQQIIVPAYRPLSLGQVIEFTNSLSGRAVPDPIANLSRTDQVEVPCDGMHLEVAQGLCQLAEIPPGQ